MFAASTREEDPSSPSETALARAAAAGDRQALGQIYDRFAPGIYSLALRQLRNREAAADVTQETFVLAAQRLAGLRDPARLRAWLFAVARHQIVDHVRQGHRHVMTGSIEDYDLPAQDAEGYDRVRQEELRQLFAGTRDGLDARDRLVLDLTYGEELTGADLAAALGVREDHAHQLLSRARQRLRLSLGALLVARRGRQDCEKLDRLLAPWDGTFSQLWRKRVARHVDACHLCAQLQSRLLSPAALAGMAPVVAVPPELRGRVLEAVGAAPPLHSSGSENGDWSQDGFPPGGQSALASLAPVTRGAHRAGRTARRSGVVAAILAGLAAASLAALLLTPDRQISSEQLDAVADQGPTPTVAATVPGAPAGPALVELAPSAAAGAPVAAEPGIAAPPPDEAAQAPPVRVPLEPSPQPQASSSSTVVAAPAPRLVVGPGDPGMPLPLSPTRGATTVLRISHTGSELADVRVEVPPQLLARPAVVPIPVGDSAEVALRWASAADAVAPVQVSVVATGFQPVRLTVVPERLRAPVRRG